jgi:hypothetical protein
VSCTQACSDPCPLAAAGKRALGRRARKRLQVGIPSRADRSYTFANIEYAGQSFSGIDDGGALEIVS